ncbi:MAG: FUSC family protein [Acidimicrobiales bacterium]
MGSSASDRDVRPDAATVERDHDVPHGVPARSGPVRWLERRDPGFRAAKRSVRAAVFVPSVFAIAVYGIGNSQTPLFAVFGAIGLLLFVDFGGPLRVRIHSYLGLWATGALLIVVGTVCSTHEVASVIAMAVVGFVVLSAGVVNPQVVTASTAALLTFVLPVAVPSPASSVGERLLGWALAGAICIPTALVVWSGRWHDRLRLTMATAARAVADLLEAGTSDEAVPGSVAAVHRALSAMRAQFEATPYRPTGAGPTDVALSNLVARLEWVGSRAVDAVGYRGRTTDLPSVARVDGAAAAVLRTIADLLGVDDPESHGDLLVLLVRRVDDLAVARRELTEVALATMASGTDAPGATAGGTPDATAGTVADATAGTTAGTAGPRTPTAALADVDPSYATRMLAFATEMVAELALQAMPPRPGRSGRWRRRWVATRSYIRFAAGHATIDSVWFRNSVRGAVALSLAVAVVEFTTVQHGFWVVLGTLSVLRSNALGTGSTAVRSVVGTAAGVVAGSLVLVGLGRHDVLLWAVLPVAVLVAAAAPSLSGFAAGQAGFTVMAVVIFNIIRPVGPSVGLVRVEDVVIGTGVSVVVGLVFWPRGASAQLARAMSQGYAAATAWLVSSVSRVGGGNPADTGGTSGPDGSGGSVVTGGSRGWGGSSDAGAPGPTDSPERARAVNSARRLDDAYRQYLNERGAKRVPLPVVTRLLTGCARIRLTAVTLERLPQMAEPGGPAPMAEVVAARRRVMEEFTSVERWFDEFAQSLGHRKLAAPPVPVVDDRLASELVDTWNLVRRTGRRDGVFAMLRLLWVMQRIDDLRALQADLAGTGGRLAA